jgi:hypothetical protein
MSFVFKIGVDSGATGVVEVSSSALATSFSIGSYYDSVISSSGSVEAVGKIPNETSWSVSPENSYFKCFSEAEMASKFI